MARREDAAFGRGDFIVQPGKTLTSEQRNEQNQLTNAFAIRTLKKLGITIPTNFDFSRLGEKRRGKGFGSPSGLTGDDLATATAIKSGITDIRTLNGIKDRLDSPGLSPQERQTLQTTFNNITTDARPNSGINQLRGLISRGTFDAGELNPIFQGFSDIGVTLRENEQGGIDVTPPADIVQPPAPPVTPELPPEPPPLEEVVGQPPPPLPPPPPPIGGVVGQPPPADVTGPGLPEPAPPTSIGAPGGVQLPAVPTVPTPEAGVPAPGQPAAQPLIGSRENPIRTTIAVPDPRIPGQLIEVPVVDRGIPGDIDRQADQFLLEREGLRQQEQNRRAFEAQRGLRRERLGETRTLLEDITRTQSQQRQAGLLEELQTGGLLQTSELESAFARESGQATSRINQAIAAQALQDRQAEVQGIGDILGKRQAFQTAGLQREFSLEDFEKAARVARETGASVTPQVGGGDNIFTGLLGGAASGASIGGGIGGGPGAAIGAGGGALLGLLGSRTGGGK